MKHGLRVAVSCPGLSGIGGGVKHGLLLIRPLLGIHNVTVFHQSDKGISAARLSEVYGTDFTGLHFQALDHEYSLRRITREYDLFVNIGYGCLDRAAAHKNILLVFFPMPIDDLNPDLSPADRRAHRWQRFRRALLELTDSVCPSLQGLGLQEYRSLYGTARTLVTLPMFALRKLGWSSGMLRRLGYPALDDYDLLLANSSYTAGWIKRFYGKESAISYPPIDTVSFTPLPKQQLMLSVGRFEPEGMSKRHDVLIQTFRILYEQGRLSGWSLVVCGGSDGSAPFEATVASLRKAAEGLPVSIEVNVPFARLRELYGIASVYLHAMGLGEDPERFPWRYEHFGMTTVEAMAAEAIPFVLAAGGQTEIVSHGKDGFLWCSLAELEGLLTDFLALDSASVARLRTAAREKALLFSEAMFYRRSCAMYRDMGIDCIDAEALQAIPARSIR